MQVCCCLSGGIYISDGGIMSLRASFLLLRSMYSQVFPKAHPYTFSSSGHGRRRILGVTVAATVDDKYENLLDITRTNNMQVMLVVISNVGKKLITFTFC